MEAPVHWSYAAKKLNAKEAVVFIKATIDEGWHIYSQKMAGGGPVKTSFNFNPSSSYGLTGTTVEPKPLTRYEDSFNMDVSFFENVVIFQQKIALKKQSAAVTGTLTYMTCNDEKCLPPETVNFEIPIK